MAWRLGRPYSLFCCRPAQLTVLLARYQGMAGTALAVLLESSLLGSTYPLGCVPSGTVRGAPSSTPEPDPHLERAGLPGQVACSPWEPLLCVAFGGDSGVWPAPCPPRWPYDLRYL